jgi:acyl carrier protein
MKSEYQIAREAILNQTGIGFDIEDSWSDLGLDSLDMFNAVIYIEDQYGYEISDDVVKKYFNIDTPAMTQLIHMMKECKIEY